MSETIDLWVVAETEVEIEDDRNTGARRSDDSGPTFGTPKAIADKLAGITRKRVPVDVALLKSQMNGMLRVVNELYTQAEVQTGMQLEEVELKVEIKRLSRILCKGIRIHSLKELPLCLARKKNKTALMNLLMNCSQSIKALKRFWESPGCFSN